MKRGLRWTSFLVHEVGRGRGKMERKEPVSTIPFAGSTNPLCRGQLEVRTSFLPGYSHRPSALWDSPNLAFHSLPSNPSSPTPSHSSVSSRPIHPSIHPHIPNSRHKQRGKLNRSLTHPPRIGRCDVSQDGTTGLGTHRDQPYELSVVCLPANHCMIG